MFSSLKNTKDYNSKHRAVAELGVSFIIFSNVALNFTEISKPKIKRETNKPNRVSDLGLTDHHNIIKCKNIINFVNNYILSEQNDLVCI